MKTTRRNFLLGAVGGALAAGTTPELAAAERKLPVLAEADVVVCSDGKKSPSFFGDASIYFFRPLGIISDDL